MKVVARKNKEMCDVYFDELLYGGSNAENVILFGNEELPELVPKWFTRLFVGLRTGDFIAELDDCFEAKNVICDFVDVHGEYEIRDKFTVWEDIYIRYFARHYTSTGSVTSLCGFLSILTGKRWDYYHLLGGDNDTWQDMFYVMEDWTEGKLRAFQSVYFGDVFSVDVYIPDIFGETTKVSAFCPAETVKELEKIFEVEIELGEEYE